MKKNLLSLLLALFTLSFVGAQVNTGQILLGGRLGVDRDVFKTVNLNGVPTKNIDATFALPLSVGFAIADNSVVGLNIGYIHTKAKGVEESVQLVGNVLADVEETGINAINSYQFGAYYQQFYTLTDKFYIVPGAEVNYMHNRSKNSFKRTINGATEADVENKGNTNNMGVAINANLMYQLTPSVALQARVFNMSYLFEVGAGENRGSSFLDVDLIPTSWQYGVVVFL